METQDLECVPGCPRSTERTEERGDPTGTRPNEALGAPSPAATHAFETVASAPSPAASHACETVASGPSPEEPQRRTRETVEELLARMDAGDVAAVAEYAALAEARGWACEGGLTWESWAAEVTEELGEVEAQGRDPLPQRVAGDVLQGVLL
jgi:hypothetical protein